VGGVAIDAEGLVKTYVTSGKKGLLRSERRVVRALRGVSFKVRHGEVVGLLGPNGAGKTTTVKIVATLLIPDSGRVLVEGFDTVREAAQVRRRIGLMLSVEKGFYGKLTGRENLMYFGALYGMSGEALRRRVDEVLDLLGLKGMGAGDRLFEEYSLGMKARLSLARALLRDPPVLLLDEPTLGLDPPTARRIRALVRGLAHDEGKAILYTTHNMFEAELVCDRILLINKGRIVAEGTPQELKSRIPAMRVLAVMVRGGEGEAAAVARVVEEHAGVTAEVKEVEPSLHEVRVRVRGRGEVIGDLIRSIASLGVDVVSLKVEEPTLEDVFIYFTTESTREETAEAAGGK